MKKLLLAALGGALLLTACSKNDNVTPQDSASVSTSSVPSAARTALTTTFPTASQVSWAVNTTDVYQADFSVSGKAAIADIQGNGKIHGIFSKIDAASLPTTITDYLNANYAGYTFVTAGVKKDSTTSAIKGYKVVITLTNVRYALLFDGTGKFVQLDTHDGKQKGTPVAQADLLAAIKTYLDTNYKGYTFVNASSHSSNGAVDGYMVLITYNGQNYFVRFDGTGKFVDARTQDVHNDGRKPGGPNSGPGGRPDWLTETAIAQSALPAAVGTYLDTNYKGWAFVGAEVGKDSAGTVVKYEVKFTLNGKSYEADFDKDGKFLRVH
ncbi:MAG: PepSY-like domain-containing protein [Spirosomataceae bacterium]